MSTYLWINCFIFIIPFLFTFHPRIRYYKKWPNFLFSFLTGGTVFLVWDYVATRTGHWSFNPAHITGIKILGLPLEEVLFFVTAPYSSLFIFESLQVFRKDRPIRIPSSLLITLALASGIMAWIFQSQYYTTTVLLFTCVSLLAGLFWGKELIGSLHFILFLAICYAPFFIFNYLLTSIPVVLYNPKAIWNIRITTIPLEDFIYSPVMLFLYYFFYRKYDRWIARKVRPD